MAAIKAPKNCPMQLEYCPMTTDKPKEANGNWKYIAPWIIAGLSVGLSMFASVKDTPTRAEVESKDRDVEYRINSRLDRIEAKLDKALQK